MPAPRTAGKQNDIVRDIRRREHDFQSEGGAPSGAGFQLCYIIIQALMTPSISSAGMPGQTSQPSEAAWPLPPLMGGAKESGMISIKTGYRDGQAKRIPRSVLDSGPPPPSADKLRWRAVEPLLGKLGKRGVPMLVHLLLDPDRRVREGARSVVVGQ